MADFLKKKILVVDLQKKSLLFATRPLTVAYFLEALDFSLPSLLVNPALCAMCKLLREHKE